MTDFVWTPGGGGQVRVSRVRVSRFNSAKGQGTGWGSPVRCNLAKILQTHLSDSNKVRPAY